MIAMRNKSVNAVVIISVFLVSLVGGLQLVEVADANFIPYGTVTITAPANQTYNSNFLILNFTATFSASNTKAITYSIDSQSNVTITGLQYGGDVLLETTNGTLPLPYLNRGPHHLEMFVKTNSTTILPGTGYASVFFTINSTMDSPTLSPTPTASPTPMPTPSVSLYPTGEATATPTFSPSPTPASTSGVYIGLSESASALNYGEMVNFTASPPEGGTSPFTFTWYVDNQQLQVVQSNDSYYFSTNTLPVGSHHVYVEVKDHNGNTATTNTVEFNVLPASSSSPSATQEPSATPSFPQENLTSAAVIVGAVAVIIIIVGLLAYTIERKKHKGKN